jgi:hypothetical protein
MVLIVKQKLELIERVENRDLATKSAKDYWTEIE